MASAPHRRDDDETPTALGVLPAFNDVSPAGLRLNGTVALKGIDTIGAAPPGDAARKPTSWVAKRKPLSSPPMVPCSLKQPPTVTRPPEKGL